jgi:hypothetical protein
MFVDDRAVSVYGVKAEAGISTSRRRPLRCKEIAAEQAFGMNRFGSP